MHNNNFVDGEIYHVFNKSIANYEIFKRTGNSLRFLQIVDYYNSDLPKTSFSKYLRLYKEYDLDNLLIPKDRGIVKFLSYCIMPDHYHLLMKINDSNKTYRYLNDIGNSFTRFFNIKFNRKGPLWQSSYKKVRIVDNEQLLHVSRYIHLNPTTAGLVDKPDDWEYSSYYSFINEERIFTNYLSEISINKLKKYKQFVENNKDYQKKLKLIKRFLLD